MKSQFKKLACFALCVCMLLSVLTVNAFAGTEATYVYQEVTAAPSDWSGEYLIVYKAKGNVFNSGLAEPDTGGNNFIVTITDGKIEANATTNAAKVVIAKSGSGYSIKLANGKYMGHSGSSNALKTSTSAIVNTLTFNSTNGSVKMACGNYSLLFNSTAGANNNRFRYYKSNQQPIHLYKLVEVAAPEHTCDFATPDYDANGHWNECACGEKDAVVPHGLTYVVDGDKHYQKCNCGYTTAKADHDFTNGACVCGAQKPNTAVLEGNIITVKAAEGYELKAGALVVTDKDGKKFVPERVGYRETDDASQYKIPDEAVAPYTLPADADLFYQPTADDLNMDLLGCSVTDNQGGGLRFVHRLNITQEGGKLYMLKDGVKAEVEEYGMLFAVQAILNNPEDLDIETAKDSMHVHQFKWPESNKYYDTCKEYVDISAHITGITAANGGNMNIITRIYVKFANDDAVYYDDVVVDNFNAVKSR